MCVTLLIAIIEKEYVTIVSLSRETVYNDSEHYPKRCAKTKATARYGTKSRIVLFIQWIGTKEILPKEQPREIFFFSFKPRCIDVIALHLYFLLYQQ